MPYIQSIAELNEIIKKRGAIIYNMLNKFIPLYLLTSLAKTRDYLRTFISSFTLSPAFVTFAEN